MFIGGPRVSADFVIRRSSDWADLAVQQLDLIVDPMIYRTVEVFLAGPPPRERDEDELAWRDRLSTAWQPISQNLQELAAFLDLLVYVDRLSMIDYLYTFQGSGHYPGNLLYRTCNESCGENEKVLHAIKVAHAPYEEARGYAIEALGKSTQKEIKNATRLDIETELTSFDHTWRPELPEVDPAYVGDDDVPGRAVDTFLYGGTLFGVYAKLASTAHVLQSKRARMLGAATVEGHRATEPDLFQAIDAAFAGHLGEKFEVDALPSVVPYLLSKGIGSPRELIQAATALRSTTMAEETRNWRSKLVSDWRDGKGISRSASNDLHRLADRLRNAGRSYKLPTPAVAEVLGQEPHMAIVGYALQAIPWDRLWLWSLPNVPGKNHLKLLHRLHSAHGTYSHVPDYWKYVDQALQRIWGRAAEPEFD
ncbi:MAG: hypothetical protein ACRDSZ_07480 [Pseudonocardiaceae bacterium]